ncbi:hypothetical protein BGX31_000980 [Mortierella sp. GBA43]|nr:hypothetical protein BGX31_000980 [Mortierella sp. GBA43]
MRTWIYSSEVGWDFVRRYPWSIVYYDGEMTRETTLADIPCSVDDTKRGQLEYLGVTSELSEVDFLTKLIQQSPNFKDFNLIVSLDSMTQFAAAQVLLSRHKAILTRMSLNRELKLLVDMIPDSNKSSSKAPLKTLNLKNTDAVKDRRSDVLLDELRKKVASIVIIKD